MISDVMKYLANSVEKEVENYIKNNSLENSIEEIRLRSNQNIVIKVGEKLNILNHKLTKQEIIETFENICEKSIYSYTKQISEGFITIKGGNRVGITGSCVIEDGKVININNVSSLNFRIARQIKEVSTPILKHVIDIQNDTIYNSIIVSAPGARKNYNIKRLNKKNFKSEYQR